MYYVKMTFTPFEQTEITEENVDELFWPVWCFLCDLYRNDQVYKHELIHDGGVFTAFFFMPEPDTMGEMNCDGSVLKGLAEMREKYKITTEILGWDTSTYKLCDCRESSWYVLYTNCNYNMSPIICGDCDGMVPAYKFNHVELPKKCQSMGGWQREYNLIKELWLLSSFDRFSYRQLSDPKSQLSKSGRAICAAYEKALGKPFYYFLFYYSDSDRARSNKCPVCGDDWSLKDDTGTPNYKCDQCRLVGV